MKIDRLIGAACGVALLAGSAAPAFAADWRGWNIHPEGYPNTIALEQFVADVNEKTEGRVTATLFNNGVLGSQPDAIEQVRAGALDFANFNMGPMGPIIPETNVLSLPFLFTGTDQMFKALDGEVGQAFSDAMQEKGLVALAWYDSGARSFYNTKKPIVTPADLEGMKIRVMNNDLYVDMIAALGGNATPMAFAEVLQSLKTGVIDGAENNWPSFESTSHFEEAGFYSLSEHLIIPECVCISTAAWEALSPEDQEIVRQAAIDSAVLQRELWAERSAASRAKVEEAGVQINEVESKAAFQEAMEPLYAAFIDENPDLAGIIEQIRATE